MPEHTCGGMYDVSCEACSMGEPENQRGPDDGGITSYDEYERRAQEHFYNLEQQRLMGNETDDY